MSILLISNQADCIDKFEEIITGYCPKLQLFSFPNPLSSVNYIVNHKDSIDAIFASVTMQPIDGFKLLDVVISTSGYIPFYFISTIDSTEFTQLAKARGAIDCLRIPLLHCEITNAISFIHAHSENEEFFPVLQAD